MAHMGNGPVSDVAATEAQLRDYIAHQDAHGFSSWAVVERDSGDRVGDAGLYLPDGRGPEIERGYTLVRARWEGATRPKPPVRC